MQTGVYSCAGCLACSMCFTQPTPTVLFRLALRVTPHHHQFIHPPAFSTFPPWTPFLPFGPHSWLAYACICLHMLAYGSMPSQQAAGHAGSRGIQTQAWIEMGFATAVDLRARGWHQSGLPVQATCRLSLPKDAMRSYSNSTSCLVFMALARVLGVIL